VTEKKVQGKISDTGPKACAVMSCNLAFALKATGGGEDQTVEGGPVPHVLEGKIEG